MINVKRKCGLQAHCETTYRNSQCPYIKLGCTGCLIKTENKHNKSRKKDAAKNRPLLSLIVRCLMIKYFQMKMERVECLLENEIGMMSPEAIKQRVRCVIFPGGNIERYFCDDKLLFEVEFIPKELKWVFRTPNQRK